MKKDFDNKDFKSNGFNKNESQGNNTNYSVSDDEYGQYEDEYDHYYEAEKFVKNSRNRKNLSKIPRRKDRSDW